MRILLIETDNLLARQLHRQLSAAGHSIDWQVDPQEAIISIDVQPVDLVIMDMVLAGRSGIEFMYEFRSYSDWATLPIVIYSSVPAREMGASAAGFQQINIRHYFYKPSTSISQLVKAIDALAVAA